MLKHLLVQQLRNITSAQLPLQQFNVITGANASGKTSLLEAVYCLSCGKSFRGGSTKTLIQQQQPSFSVVGWLDHPTHPYSIGIERNASDLKIKIAGNWVKTVSELARQFAVQIIHPESHEIFTQGSLLRRQLMDWGIFYNQPDFFSIWRRYSQALQQRNRALKNEASPAAIRAWHPELIKTGELLIQYRQAYSQQLMPYLQEYIQALLNLSSVDMALHSGLMTGKTLSESLEHSFSQDVALGHTRYGAHRSDWVFKINKIPVQYYLSRAQQKLLICALRLAQARLLRTWNQQPCVLLLDDLPAELDASRREALMTLLLPLEMQVLVTTTDEGLLPLKVWPNFALFYMKQGECWAR